MFGGPGTFGGPGPGEDPRQVGDPLGVGRGSGEIAAEQVRLRGVLGVFANRPTAMLTTVKRLLNAPHREQLAAAAARQTRAMAKPIGTGTNAAALTSFLQR